MPDDSSRDADRSASPRARGAASNPPNRYARLHYEPEPGEELASDRTRAWYLRDTSRSVISWNDSPDVPFRASLNPYRGCEHGCAYCYARPSHEYLGFSAGLDFETRILVKEDAPELLRRELSSPKWEPEPLALSGVTDAFQPLERRLGITRRCLEVLAEFRQPVMIVTKNALIRRDLDHLKTLAAHDAVSVSISLASLDDALWREMEPRASPPGLRLETIAELSAAGVPTGVILGPVIPGLNDHEIPDVVAAAARAGASSAWYLLVRLPGPVAPLFEEWLERSFPDRKDKILSRIRAVRGGRLNDPRFGHRMRGEGIFAEQIESLFRLARKRAGLEAPEPRPSGAHFRRPGGRQLEFFE